MISIIVPTLNEENHLPLLLQSLKDQKLKDFEIIVADAGSTDMTLSIARTYGCTIISGGLPAKGRNEGALMSRGDLLVFVDADVVLPANFFVLALKEFNDRNLAIASFGLKTYPENKFIDLLVEIFYNKPMILLEKVLPHAAIVIFMKPDLFKKTNGFDEAIKLAEDHDLARRANKVAKFGVIRSVKIFTSDRRVKVDGWFRTGIKFFLCELHMLFLGPVKSDLFKYKFNHYKKNQN